MSFSSLSSVPCTSSYLFSLHLLPVFLLFLCKFILSICSTTPNYCWDGQETQEGFVLPQSSPWKIQPLLVVPAHTKHNGSIWRNHHESLLLHLRSYFLVWKYKLLCSLNSFYYLVLFPFLFSLWRTPLETREKHTPFPFPWFHPVYLVNSDRLYKLTNNNQFKVSQISNPRMDLARQMTMPS